MAILIKEEGVRQVNFIRIGLWVVMLVAIVIATYYVFFAKPGLVEVVSPPTYKNIDPLAKIKLNPQQVVSGAAFKSLQQYVPLPVPGAVGREDPFIAP